MKRFCLGVSALLASLQLVACGDPVEASGKKDPAESIPDMVRVKASTEAVVLGTDDASAKANERPEMKVVLDYDFSIGKHEVTCGEFNALMKEATGLQISCDQENLPATNLTYFDAVLFANARSKNEKRDTVYTYTKATFDREKHCMGLDGLAFRAETESYRLPTEAEWVAVAKNNWDVSKGWTGANSESRLHEVCSVEGSEFEVCDMVGNALEWVNDWLGNFSDTTLTNYVGAPDGGSLGLRIVKGGSYFSSPESIHLYNRGDIYTVTSATRSIYVGFRLAYGKVPDATWMGSDGRAFSNVIVPLAASTKVHSLSGTYKVKLVFRNDLTGNLAFIDYASGILSVTEIVDNINAYHPEISPDGKKVAFCTGLEGVNSDTSVVYVRDLNAEGSNLVKLDVVGAAIPRWRVLDNGDTVLVYVTNPRNNEEESAFTETSTWQVKFANGKFYKPEKLFDGAYHGGISEDNTLAVSGARLLRARVAKSGSTVTEKARDTIWYDEKQACNVSLARDGSKRTLFLDFGGEPGRKFVGKKYDSHERLLMLDGKGKLVNAFAAPNGYSFDHAEWTSGGEDIAVATLTNINGAHTKIVLVDLSDSSVVDLVEGEELWHPNMWVKDPPPASKVGKLDLDSAGAYMTVNTNIATRLMKVKMDYFWKYRDTTEIVIIGSSRSFAGMDPEYIESGFAINMAYSAQDMESTSFFLTNYVLPLMPKLKVIALTLDYDRWYVMDENFSSWFADIPGYEYDKNHDYWKNGTIGDMYAVGQAALNPTDEEYAQFGYHRGLYYDEARWWGIDNPEVPNDSLWFDYDKDGVALNFNLKKLRGILDLASERDVFVVGVVYPQSPNYLKTGAWGRYGPTRRAAKVMQDSVQKLTEKYSNFAVLDEYHDGYHDFVSEDFANEDHLGLAGAKIMAHRLDSLLKIVR